MTFVPTHARSCPPSHTNTTYAQNEENITSAAITSLPENQGHILAISTIAHLKLFHLRPAKPSSSSEALRVRKINLPTSLILEVPGEELDEDEEADDINLAAEGARLVKFSPDGRWLTLITPASRVLMVELVASESERKMKVIVGEKVLELQRPKRLKSPGALKQALHNAIQISKSTKKKRHVAEGSLDNYEQTINRVAFSSGSKILAVADLSGWLDTFVFTEGKWAYNTKGATLPKLSSASVVLEFRPAAPSSAASPNLMIAENSLEGAKIPDAEDRLLAITGKDHHIFEFHVLQGRLSDWSRRNPPAEKLPHDFRIQKDRATGVTWEVSAEKERMWVWASSWVWMFDLRQDLPVLEGVEVHAEVAGGKRKRDVAVKAPASKAPIGFAGKGESGAGDRILPGQSRGLLPMPKKAGKPSTSASDEDDDDEDMLGLVSGNKNTRTEDEDDEDNVETKEKRNWKQTGYDARNKPYWRTNRYRNLMAFLPVGGKETSVEKKAGRNKMDTVEIVVVERPSWDIEMPPRFYAGGTGFV